MKSSASRHGRRARSRRVTRSSRCHRATTTCSRAIGCRSRAPSRTPHPENNVVRARYFPEQSERGRRRAVLVLPQWNADAGGHVGLCRLLNRFGISALRLSLPYHDARMPPGAAPGRLHRQRERRTDGAGVPAGGAGRPARDRLARDARGTTSIGILGTSLGSCLSMLTAAHEPLVRAAALNHISPYFADVIWEGLSTAHVRESLNGRIELDALRRIWMPISPFPYLERVRGKHMLLVYARYDLTFPVALSRFLVDEFKRRGIDHEVAVLPCGHYSTGVTPVQVDGRAGLVPVSEPEPVEHAGSG